MVLLQIISDLDFQFFRTFGTLEQNVEIFENFEKTLEEPRIILRMSCEWSGKGINSWGSREILSTQSFEDAESFSFWFDHNLNLF